MKKKVRENVYLNIGQPIGHSASKISRDYMQLKIQFLRKFLLISFSKLKIPYNIPMMRGNTYAVFFCNDKTGSSFLFFIA